MHPWLRDYYRDAMLALSQRPPWTPAVHSVWNPQTGRIRVYDEDGYTLLAEGNGDQEEARRLVSLAKDKRRRQ